MIWAKTPIKVRLMLWAAIALWFIDVLIRKLKGEPFLSDVGDDMQNYGQQDNRNFFERLLDRLRSWFRGKFGTGTKL